MAINCSTVFLNFLFRFDNRFNSDILLIKLNNEFLTGFRFDLICLYLDQFF